MRLDLRNKKDRSKRWSGRSGEIIKESSVVIGRIGFFFEK